MLRPLFLLFVIIVSAGTTGYMIIEKWNFLDSLYMTVITLTTTGFREVHPLSELGRLFTVCVLLGGVGIITYIVTSIINIFMEGKYKRAYWRKKMKKRIDKMKHHTIICGFGRMGETVCDEFVKKEKPFIVVESDEEKEQELQEKKYAYIIGDASNEATLEEANIKTAKSLISVVSTDAQNVYTVLTARELNKDIYIVSRAVDVAAHKKIIHAGANKVVRPYAIASNRIAKTILDPAANDFVDFTFGHDFDVELADIFVHAKSPLVGKSILESEIRKKEIIIVGIKQTNGQIIFAPSPRRKIQLNERIIALGPKQIIKEFNIPA